MARPCSVCQHAALAVIDEALVAGTAIAALAAKHGLSRDSIERHRAHHLVGAIAKASEAEETARGDDLLGQVRDLQAKALGILARAEEAGDLRAATGAIREARGCLELLGKLAGELADGVTVNIGTSPEWQRVRGALLVVLAPFPEARQAVAQALLGAGDARA